MFMRYKKGAARLTKTIVEHLFHDIYNFSKKNVSQPRNANSEIAELFDRKSPEKGLIHGKG